MDEMVSYLVDIEEHKIREKIDEIRAMQEGIFSDIQKSGLPRNHKARFNKRTVEENLDRLIQALDKANKGPYKPGLLEKIQDIHLELWDYGDWFFAYEHESGEEVLHGHSIYTVGILAEEIAIAILARKHYEWNGEDVQELKQIREDLKKTIKASCYDDDYVPLVIKDSGTGASRYEADEAFQIVAVDKQKRYLITFAFDHVFTEDEMEDSHLAPSDAW
jgi:hypothetical protein